MKAFIRKVFTLLTAKREPVKYSRGPITDANLRTADLSLSKSDIAEFWGGLSCETLRSANLRDANLSNTGGEG